jgi:hypothetical protein
MKSHGQRIEFHPALGTMIFMSVCDGKVLLYFFEAWPSQKNPWQRCPAGQSQKGEEQPSNEFP